MKSSSYAKHKILQKYHQHEIAIWNNTGDGQTNYLLPPVWHQAKNKRYATEAMSITEFERRAFDGDTEIIQRTQYT